MVSHAPGRCVLSLTFLGPQSRFVVKSLGIREVCSRNGTAVCPQRVYVNPSSTAVPTWAHRTLIPSDLSPNRDCSTKWVNAALPSWGLNTWN